MPKREHPNVELAEFHNPADRFGQLPEPTRQWLEKLREGDLEDLAEAMRFYHDFKSFRRFGRWLILTVVGVFVVSVQFGEAIQKLIGLVRKGTGQ